MSEEAGFIQSILADPRNAFPRLVYADWLEERGDADSARRAEYLRVECALDASPSGSHQRRRLQSRLLQLRGEVGDDWWRQLDWAKVEYCVEFEYRCPQRWDTLQTTDNAAVRHCSQCQRNVYYCRSFQEVRRRADAGQCVAMDSRLARVSLSLVRTRLPAGRLLGKVAPSIPVRLPLHKRGPAPKP
jgi:uncharacterized protein (TIGR02996 family)